MLRIFSQINITSFLLFPGLIFAYVFLHNTVHKGLYTFESLDVFYLGVWGEARISTTANFVVNCLLILANASLLNWVFNKLNIYERNTFFPGFIYVILLTNTRELNVFDGALIFHFLLIAALYVASQITFNKQYLEPMFNLGFLVGLACTFFPLLYFVFILFYLLTLNFKSYKLREAATYIAGWLIPQLFMLFFLYYHRLFTIEYLYDCLFPFYTVPLYYFIKVILLGVVVIVVFLTIKSAISNTSIHLKKFINGLIVLTLVGVAFSYYFYLVFDNTSLFQSFIVPLAFLFAIVLLKKQHLFVPLITFYAAFIFSFLKFFFI